MNTLQKEHNKVALLKLSTLTSVPHKRYCVHCERIWTGTKWTDADGRPTATDKILLAPSFSASFTFVMLPPAVMSAFED